MRELSPIHPSVLAFIDKLSLDNLAVEQSPPKKFVILVSHKSTLQDAGSGLIDHFIWAETIQARERGVDVCDGALAIGEEDHFAGSLNCFFEEIRFSPWVLTL
jgi:hypothetical protein